MIDKCELCSGSGWQTWRNADGYLLGKTCPCTQRVKDENGQAQVLTYEQRMPVLKSYVLEHEKSRPDVPKRQWMGKKLCPKTHHWVEGAWVPNPDFDENNPLHWEWRFGVWNDDEIPQDVIDRLWGGQ